MTVLQQPPSAEIAADHQLESLTQELSDPSSSPDTPVEESSRTPAAATSNERAAGVAIGDVVPCGSGGDDSAQDIESLRLRKGDPILVVDDSTISSKLAMRKLRAMG